MSLGSSETEQWPLNNRAHTLHRTDYFATQTTQTSQNDLLASQNEAKLAGHKEKRTASQGYLGECFAEFGAKLGQILTFCSPNRRIRNPSANGCTFFGPFLLVFSATR